MPLKFKVLPRNRIPNLTHRDENGYIVKGTPAPSKNYNDKNGAASAKKLKDLMVQALTNPDPQNPMYILAVMLKVVMDKPEKLLELAKHLVPKEMELTTTEKKVAPILFQLPKAGHDGYVPTEKTKEIEAASIAKETPFSNMTEKDVTNFLEKLKGSSLAPNLDMEQPNKPSEPLPFANPWEDGNYHRGGVGNPLGLTKNIEGNKNHQIAKEKVKKGKKKSTETLYNILGGIVAKG